MTNFLLRKFIKNYDKTNDVIVRKNVGLLSSILGLVANIILFAFKIFFGTIANSIAIISDGFNNLSDSFTCVITIFGYRLSAKPADKDHPFGHGRMEYLTSLILAFIIIIVALKLLMESFNKIFHPDLVNFNYLTIICLVFSILVKVIMSIFNKELGNKYASSIMKATSQDSLNDCFATLGTLIALCISPFTTLPIDGIMGCIVAIIILFSGYSIIKETIDSLLGSPIDKQVEEELIKEITKDDLILGVHDLIVHNYGPGKQFASAHVEISAKSDLMATHDVVDSIERVVMEKYNILLTLHMDPIDEDDETVNHCRVLLQAIIKQIDSSLSIHDVRVVSGPTHTNLVFDILVPYSCQYPNNKIKEMVDEQLKKEPIKYYTVITFDRSYTE